MFNFFSSLTNAARRHTWWAILAIFCCFYSDNLLAASLTLAWNPSLSANVNGYRVHYGRNRGSYTSSINVGNKTSYTVTGLSAGATYYFAVTAYNSTTESGFSNEVSLTTPIAASIQADFSVTSTSAVAPSVVSFSDTSTGDITSRTWTFGDGSTGSGKTALKSYSIPGTYTVSLTASGPSGSDTITKTGFISVTDPVPGTPGPNPNTDPNPSIAGLVVAYGFEEDSGAQVQDTSGAANHGTIEGASRIAQGRFGQALSFNGSSDWVTVNDDVSLDLTNGMTLEAWVYPTEAMSGWCTILLKEQSDDLVYALFATADNTVNSIHIDTELDLFSGSPLPLNTWTHLAATYDGTRQRLYINGVEVANEIMSGSMPASDGALRIGGNSIWGDFFKGYIDEVRVYDRALSASDIQADMVIPISY